MQQRDFVILGSFVVCGVRCETTERFKICRKKAGNTPTLITSLHPTPAWSTPANEWVVYEVLYWTACIFRILLFSFAVPSPYISGENAQKLPSHDQSFANFRIWNFFFFRFVFFQSSRRFDFVGVFSINFFNFLFYFCFAAISAVTAVGEHVSQQVWQQMTLPPQQYDVVPNSSDFPPPHPLARSI